MSKGPSIPPILGLEPAITRILSPMKEAIERVRGQRPGVAKIVALPQGASTTDIINKLNEIIERMQG